MSRFEGPSDSDLYRERILDGSGSQSQEENLRITVSPCEFLYSATIFHSG